MEKFKASKRSTQLLPLMEQYNAVGWMHRHNNLEDTMWVIMEGRVRGERKELEMFYMAEDYELLPLFCVILDGGDMITCYEKEKDYCECGAKLEICEHCGGLVCPDGCDDEEENNEK